MLLDIAGSSKTHWRYSIVAVRCLRTLVRKDESISAPHFKFFVENTYDDHPSIVRSPSVGDQGVVLMYTLCSAIRKLRFDVIRDLFTFRSTLNGVL